MSLKTAIFVVALITTVSISSQSHAQQDCSKALILNTNTGIFTLRSQIAQSVLLQQSEFEKWKKDIIGTGSAYVKGVPITADLSYSEFRQRNSNYLKSMNLEISLDVAKSWLVQEFSENALRAYIECLRLNSSRSGGFTAFVHKADSDKVLVTFGWHPIGSKNSIDFDVVSLDGASDPDGDFNKNLTANSFRTRRFNRETGTDFELTVEAAGQLPISVEVFKLEPIPEPKLPCFVEIYAQVNAPAIGQNYPKVGANADFDVWNSGGEFHRCATDDRCYVKSITQRNGKRDESNFEEKRANSGTMYKEPVGHSLSCEIVRRIQ